MEAWFERAGIVKLNKQKLGDANGIILYYASKRPYCISH